MRDRRWLVMPATQRERVVYVGCARARWVGARAGGASPPTRYSEAEMRSFFCLLWLTNNHDSADSSLTDLHLSYPLAKGPGYTLGDTIRKHPRVHHPRTSITHRKLRLASTHSAVAPARRSVQDGESGGWNRFRRQRLLMRRAGSLGAEQRTALSVGIFPVSCPFCALTSSPFPTGEGCIRRRTGKLWLHCRECRVGTVGRVRLLRSYLRRCRRPKPPTTLARGRC